MKQNQLTGLHACRPLPAVLWGLALTALMSLPTFAQQPVSPANSETETDVAIEEVEVRRRYSVEFIVFQHSDSTMAGNELFEPDLPPEPDPLNDELLLTDSDDLPSIGDDSSIEFAEAMSPPTEPEPVDPADVEIEEIIGLNSMGFEIIPPENFTMVEIHEKMILLDAYQPVLWGGWIQEVFDEQQTQAIRLRTLGSPPLNMDGYLTLYLKNFLHLSVELTLEQQLAVAAPVFEETRPSYYSRDGYGYADNSAEYTLNDVDVITFQIDEDRIFRSGELRYFDHPKFGVLVRINRVVEPEPEEENNPQGPTMLSRSP